MGIFYRHPSSHHVCRLQSATIPLAPWHYEIFRQVNEEVKKGGHDSPWGSARAGDQGEFHLGSGANLPGSDQKIQN